MRNLRLERGIECTSLHGAPLSDDFPMADVLVEPKYDGHRKTLELRGGEAVLVARSGAVNAPADWMCDLAAACPDLDVMFDGELLPVQGGGCSQVKRLGSELEFVAFDILWHDGEDLRGLPLSARRERLVSGLAGIASTGTWPIRPSDCERRPVFTAADAQSLLATATAEGVEGFVVKPLAWTLADGLGFKLKPIDTADAFVVSLKQRRQPGGGHSGLVGSLGVAQLVAGRETFVGWVALPASLKVPFDGADERFKGRVVEFRHRGREAGRFRFPTFLGWRDGDKAASQCIA